VGARRRAVGEHHPAGAPAPVERDEGLEDPGAHGSGADNHDVAPGQAAVESLLGQLDRAWLNDVVPRAMAVSERTRLPVWTA